MTKCRFVWMTVETNEKYHKNFNNIKWLNWKSVADESKHKHTLTYTTSKLETEREKKIPNPNKICALLFAILTLRWWARVQNYNGYDEIELREDECFKKNLIRRTIYKRKRREANQTHLAIIKKQNIKEEIKKITEKKHREELQWEKKIHKSRRDRHRKMKKNVEKKTSDEKTQQWIPLEQHHNGIVWLRNVLKHTYRVYAMHTTSRHKRSRCRESEVSNSGYRLKFRSCVFFLRRSTLCVCVSLSHSFNSALSVDFISVVGIVFSFNGNALAFMPPT